MWFSLYNVECELASQPFVMKPKMAWNIHLAKTKINAKKDFVSEVNFNITLCYTLLKMN